MTSDLYCGWAVIALVAFSAAGYGWHRLRSSGENFGRVDRQGGSALLGRPVMNFGYWSLTWPGRWLASLGVSPDVISWTGLAWACAAGLAAADGRFGTAALAAVLSGACDALDGMVAEIQGRKSPGGVVLDSTLDRYADFALLAGAAYFYRWSPATLMAALLAMHGSYMVSYATAKAEATGREGPRGLMKRPERWVWLMAGLLASSLIRPWISPSASSAGWPFAASIVLVALLSNVSAARRLWWVWVSSGGRPKT